MLVPRFVVSLIFAALAAHSARAYSGPGHRFVGALAEELLEARAKSPDKAEAARASAALAKARLLLGNLSFADAATIPDEIKDWDAPRGKFHAIPDELIKAKGWPTNLATNIKAYYAKNLDRKSGRYHHEYHYTDIAIAPGAPLAYSLGKVGTNQYDIVQTLKYCEQRLRGPVPDDGRGITPEIALILLIHMTGDLHQPLHVGAAYFNAKGVPVAPTQEDLDKHIAFGAVGGNGLDVSSEVSAVSFGKPGVLHHVWDVDIADRAFAAWKITVGAKSKDPLVLAAILANPKYEPAKWQPLPKSPGAPLTATWEKWATEILPLAQQAHDKFKVPFTPVETPKSTFHGKAELKNPAEDYNDWGAPLEQRELLLAGWRLAWVIETTLK